MNTLTCERVQPSNPRAFVFAGNAYVTVRSKKTGTRYTFNVRRATGSIDPPWFVSGLTGSDNSNDYHFLGVQFVHGAYVHGRKSRISRDAPIARAASWFIWRLFHSLPLTTVEIFHEGRCGRCGRRLTVPESIITGIGPECAKL